MRDCPIFGVTVTVSKMFITVHDPEVALGFYRDALGLQVRQDVENDGFRWVTLGPAGHDVEIVLSQPHGGRSQSDGDALLALVMQGSMQAAIFRTMISRPPSTGWSRPAPKCWRSRPISSGGCGTVPCGILRETWSASSRHDGDEWKDT